MDIDKDTKKMLISNIQNAPTMQKQKNQHMCSDRAVLKVEKMAKDIAKFSSYQYANGAALVIQSAFRKHIACKERDRIKALWNQNRVDAFSSLIKKESAYVFDLATVISQYVMPLQVTTDKQLKQMEGDFKIIFSNIEQILRVHELNLSSLRKLSETNWPTLQGLGDLFIEISQYWHVYGIYVHNFKVSRDLLFECITKCEKFNLFLDERTIKLSTDLNMLLSKPLNYISGYELILKKFLEETEEGSAEHTSILQAVILTGETSTFISSALEKAANLAHIEKVKRNVLDLPAAICLEISAAQSQFITQINVDFSIPNGKKTSSGVLYLFHKIIILAVSTHRGLNYKHSYDLSSLTAQINENDPKEFSLLIIDEERPAYDNVVEGSRFDFIVDCEGTRDKIVKEIKEYISRNQRTRSKFTKNSIFPTFYLFLLFF